MKLYELVDKAGATIGFEPTKAEAEKAQKIYGGPQVAVIKPFYLKPTREGICQALTTYGGGAG